jgi:hypothetical protein
LSTGDRQNKNGGNNSKLISFGDLFLLYVN